MSLRSLIRENIFLIMEEKANTPEKAVFSNLNKDISYSDSLLEWMKYEEGKLDSLGKGTGEPHLKSYDDGKGNLTIGYGRNQNYQTIQTTTKEKSIEYLKSDLEKAAESIKSSSNDPNSSFLTIAKKLTQNQFDALTSIVFNAGPAGYSRTDLHKNFISKKNALWSGKQFEDAFLSAATSSGFGGIDTRRIRELDIFKNGSYNKK